MTKKYIIIIFSVIMIFLFLSFVFIERNKLKINDDRQEKIIKQESKTDYNFNLSLIKEVNKSNIAENYLISPYSIEIALNMLKEGANGNTYNEIEKAVGTRHINDISVKDKVSIANALFISKKYESIIENSFVDTLSKKYYSDVLYDEFKSPELINSWVNKKTYGMIEKILDNLDSNFVLGLANALAIDVDWLSSFDCNATSKYNFTKNNDEVLNAEMMSKKYDDGIEYFNTNKCKGVIIPYQKYNSQTGEEVFDDENGKQLEFVGILPSVNINTYISILNEQDIKDIDNNKKSLNSNESLKLRIPRFSYDYSLNDFAKVLNDLGMIDSFNPDKADFSKIISPSNQQENIYIGEAIHKTHIDFNEKGTKAAAITYFGMYKSSVNYDEKIIEMNFDKPFIYIIRDKETKEWLFFGVVYEPNLWNGNTCSK